jgi:DNA-binding response OmpR family regulator
MAELKTIVLVVDDEIKLCQALSRVLANAGYRVYICCQSAIMRHFRTEHFQYSQ